MPAHRPISMAFSHTAAAGALAMALLLSCIAGAQEVPSLQQGTTLERSLSGGQSHAYRIPASAGQFLHVVVEQQGIDVEVTLLAPDGKRMAHMDSANGAWGPETIVAIADAGGEYRLQVACGNPQSGTAKYRLHLVAVREATAADRERVSVNGTFDHAMDLLAKGDAASLQEAAGAFAKAAAFYKASGLRYEEALTLYSLGLVSAQRGDFRRALDYYEQCLPMFRAMADKPMQGSTVNNMGGAFDVLGEPAKAAEAYARALPLLRTTGDRFTEAITLNNIGKLDADMGKWEEAGEYYQQAAAIFHASGDPDREAIALTNLGGISYLLGEPGKALNEFRQALALNRAAGNKRGQADTLVQMGNAYQKLGQAAEGIQAYEDALKITRSIGDRWREGRTLNGLGLAYSLRGDREKALEALQQSLKLLQGVNDRRGEALTLSVLGQVYAAIPQPEKAAEAYKQAVNILQEVGDRSHQATALLGLAQVERDRKQFTEARKHAEEALSLVEQVRSHAGGQEDRASYFATQQSTGEFYIDLLMRLHQQDPNAGHDVEAFNAAERARARSLLEMLAETRVDFRQGVDPKLLERERELSGLLNSRSQRLLMLRGPGADEKAAALKKEIAGIEGEYRQLELQIRKSSPVYSAIMQPQPLTLKEIQQQVLDPESMLLEYALGDQRSYLFAVTVDGFKTYALPPRNEIEKSVRQVHGLLTARTVSIRGETTQEKQRRLAQADLQFREASAALSQMVLASAAAAWGNRRLVIVADGALQLVPFAVLPVPGSITPLVVEHELVALPSASTVAELRKQVAGRRPAPEMVAVLADPVFSADDPRVVKSSAGAPPAAPRAQNKTETADASRILVHLANADSVALAAQLQVPRLPFTRQEANRIVELAGAKESLEALDFRASLDTIAGAPLGRYRYLHFATHGYLDSEHPELSSLVLSLVDQNGKAQDGFLRSQDIYNMKLGADLVVLSACQTGLGKEIRGEGIVGLPRGFMYAGAPSVIVSMWSVNDRATEELMAAFYKKLLKDHIRPSAALRQAQIDMYRSKKWSAPFYWGAFIQQGEWR
ncbi:MAG TPA: CHAT domain-containing protein [Candidatus Angelobacter sp.]